MPLISICIPLRNEAAELPGLFEALDQLELDGGNVVRVCLLLDGCTDASSDIIRDYGERSTFEILTAQAAPSPANAGRARHRAMMLGVQALRGGDGLLLTTDADSRPSVNWLAAMTAALGKADVVAGRIVRAGSYPSPVQDRIEAYYDALSSLRRRLDPVPWEASATHHFTGGANIGVHADAYRSIGGFAPIASGEDARLIDDAARLGLHVRRDASSLVYTSDRREGRATGGLASALRCGDRDDPTLVHVAHPEDASWQYRMQSIARGAYATERPGLIGEALGLSEDHVLGVARDCPNAEAFAMRIVPVPPGGMREVTLPTAEAALATLIGERLAA